MQILNWPNLSEAERKSALSRSPLVGDEGLEQTVAAIVNTVRTSKDAALLSYSQQFDGVSLTELKLSTDDISTACARVSGDIKLAIAQAMANIESFHLAQKFAPISIETQVGKRCELRSEAIEKVGLYIPGGTAPLISTVMMLALPAKNSGL